MKEIAGLVEGITSEFFSYWNKLPRIKYVRVSDYIESTDKKLRRMIMQSLTTGIADTNPETGKPQIRRVLSVKEIKESINQLLSDDILQSSLYFHLDKLEKNGLIQEVFTMRRGKRFTTFYGKTAHMLLFEGEDDYETLLFESLKDNNIHELLKEFNPKISPKAISKSIQELIEASNSDIDEFNEWVKSHETVINLSTHNIIDFYKLYSSILNRNKLHDALEAMGKYLKIE